MRVTSSSRASILPSADPYDLVRRSRLSSDSSSQFRARSSSPGKSRKAKSEAAPGRKSILECDINPYELMSADASITLVNGQRIRVRPPSTDAEYEDVQVKRPAPKVPPAKSKILPNEKESESNRFKSILKKPTTTFSDTDSNSREHSPSPAHKTGSHFYLPMPGNTPRKKVQFLVENELEVKQEDGAVCVSSDPVEADCEAEMSNEEGQGEDKFYETLKIERIAKKWNFYNWLVDASIEIRNLNDKFYVNRSCRL